MENKLSELSELIKAAQSGDNGAVETLYEEYAKSVFYLALKLLSNKEDAEDITQEVFIYVYQKIGDLKNPETFPVWLHRITTSKCNNFFKKKQVTLNIADEEIAQSDFFEEKDPLLIPDRTFDNAETAEIITKIIDGLPLPQKVCIYYYYYQRMTITQISETLNASESTIKNRLALAREKIRKAIEEIERKDGIKLYGALPLMLTSVLMKSLQNFEMPPGILDGMFNTITANISNMAGTASTVTSSTAGTASTAATAATAAKTATTAATANTAAATEAATFAATAAKSAIGLKAVAAVIAGVLSIGGITTAILLSGNNESEPETIPAAIVQTEANMNNEEENSGFVLEEPVTLPMSTNSYLKKLIELYESQGEEAVIEEMRTDEFENEFSAAMSATGNQPAIYAPEGETGGGFYSVDDDFKFVYIGGYSGQLRSGQGVWLSTFLTDVGNWRNYSFVGSWANDKPNGEGTITYVTDKRFYERMPWKEIRKGTFADGLEHGSIALQDYLVIESGDEYSGVFNFTAENGRRKVIGVLESGVEYIAVREEGFGFYLAYEDRIHGVLGFIINESTPESTTTSATTTTPPETTPESTTTTATETTATPATTTTTPRPTEPAPPSLEAEYAEAEENPAAVAERPPGLSDEEWVAVVHGGGIPPVTTTAARPASLQGPWDGIWVKGAHTMSITNNASYIYVYDANQGYGFSISASVREEEFENGFTTVMSDSSIDYYAKYYFVFNGDTLEFTHFYGHGMQVIDSSGTYTFVPNDPRAGQRRLP